MKISVERVVLGLVCMLAEAAFCSQNHSKSVDDQVEDLMSRMTLEEKVGQLNLLGGHVEELHENEARSGMLGAYVPTPGDVVQMHDDLVRIKKIAAEESRLRIPPIIGFDLIHGAKTVFPIPLALAASFDPEVWTSMAQVTAREARAIGIDWTFAPMMDVGRDARWGRVAEGAGEDPFLNACLAETLVLGYQGAHPGGPESIAACAKHFVAYGACEGGRDYDTAELSKSTLYNVYLPPFRAAVDAGVLTVMNGFHDLDGVPMVMNQDLLRGVLKGEWGFSGFVVSDAFAIPELINHGVAASRAEAAPLSLSAGTDMDLGGQCYRHELVSLVENGTVPVRMLDDAVRRILRVKGTLGLLSGEPVEAPSDWQHVVLSAEHRTAAWQAACASMVLLKNNRNVLPLSKESESIAVIGQLADDAGSMLGCWAPLGQPSDVVSILSGIRSTVSPGTRVDYAPGYSGMPRYTDEEQLVQALSTNQFSQALAVAKKAGQIILVLGENRGESGEACSRADIDLPGVQRQLAEQIFSLGKPTVVVLAAGRALAVDWLDARADAVLAVWHGGVETGNAVGDILFGDYNPAGRLPVTFPRRTGQCPLYYGYMNAGRPRGAHPVFSVGYCDLTCEPLYPFGYGLSYTAFEYSGLTIDPPKGLKGTVRIAVDVRNTGDRAGDEVVQLYVHDVVASQTRPVKELKGFQRIPLEPGQKRTVRFKLPVETLGFFDGNGTWHLEPGLFEVFIGGSSEGGLKSSFSLGTSHTKPVVREQSTYHGAVEIF